MNTLPAIPEEIRQLIGTYLDRQTLSTVIQVSRALHSSFIPLLWKQAELRGGFWDDYVKSGAGATYNSTDNEGFTEKCRSQLPSPPPSPGLHSSSPSSLMMDLTLLQSRSRHIEHLTISAPIPSDYYTVTFPRLRTLVLTDDYASTGSLQDIVQLARLNPTIERLVINDIQSSLPAQFWETVYSEWKNPRTLCIRYSPISKDNAAVAALWRASTRFEDLELQGVDLPHYATASSPTIINNNNNSSDSDDEVNPSSPLAITTFSKVKRVHLSITINARQIHPFFNPSQQLAMMQSCSNLREFVWDGSHFHIDAQLSSQFTTALHPDNNSNNPNGRTTCWPHLESLVLLHISFRRTDPLRRRRLAEILSAVPVLKSLQIRGGVWEPFAMNALRAPGRHFETLERVSVQGCKGFSSSMVHEVLSQCAGLREFCADFIYAQDVVLDVASSSTPTSGTGTLEGGGGGVQPWACQGRLKSLKICIYATPLDSTSTTSSNSNCTARQALLQLATLTQLEHLDLRRNLVDERPLLNLTLASGLDALVALTRLRSFQFDDCYGSTGGREGWVMGEEEMSWMMNRWRVLEEVTGPFRSPSMMEGAVDEDEVRAVFNQRHITYSSVGVVERH